MTFTREDEMRWSQVLDVVDVHGGSRFDTQIEKAAR